MHCPESSISALGRLIFEIFCNTGTWRGWGEAFKSHNISFLNMRVICVSSIDRRCFFPYRLQLRHEVARVNISPIRLDSFLFHRDDRLWPQLIVDIAVDRKRGIVFVDMAILRRIDIEWFHMALNLEMGVLGFISPLSHCLSHSFLELIGIFCLVAWPNVFIDLKTLLFWGDCQLPHRHVEVHLLAHHFADKLHKLVLFFVAEVRSKAAERLILANKNIHNLEAHGIFSVSFLLLRHEHCAV